MHDLLLQGHCRGGDHQTFAGGLGHGNRRQAVGHRLAGASAGLDRHHGGLALAPTFPVDLNRAQHLGDVGDHQALAITRLERLGFEKTRVGALDLGLEFGTEHGIWTWGLGAKRLDKFSVSDNGRYHSALSANAQNPDWSFT
ncbi:hypothetical protein D3C80_1462140 [compost metagenome]